MQPQVLLNMCEGKEVLGKSTEQLVLRGYIYKRDRDIMGMRPPAEAVEGLQVLEVLWFGFAGLWEQQGQLRVCKRAILWSVRHRLAGHISMYPRRVIEHHEEFDGSKGAQNKCCSFLFAPSTATS